MKELYLKVHNIQPGIHIDKAYIQLVTQFYGAVLKEKKLEWLFIKYPYKICILLSVRQMKKSSEIV